MSLGHFVTVFCDAEALLGQSAATAFTILTADADGPADAISGLQSGTVKAEWCRVPDTNHSANDFMAGNRWSRLLPPSGDCVQVTAADCAEIHPDDSFTGTRERDGKMLQLQWLCCVMKDCSQTGRRKFSCAGQDPAFCTAALTVAAELSSASRRMKIQASSRPAVAATEIPVSDH